MKAVMLSIRPKWCELIARGEKVLEVRKTCPKLETPFKCYIYKTRGFMEHPIGNITFGCVIGEFVCDRIDTIRKRGVGDNFDYCYLSLNTFGNDDIEAEIRDISGSCIPKEDLNAYGYKSPCLYAWNISDLKIYDIPKPLSEFKPWKRECKYSDLGLAIPECQDCHDCKMEKPPQSWCYVVEMEAERDG